MPDQTEQQQQQPTGLDAGTSGTPQPQTQGRIEDLPAWAQDIIRNTREEAAQRRVELKRLMDAQQQRLADQGNWKELAEQRSQEVTLISQYKERAEVLEKMIRESNSSRIASVREDMRALIPVDYPPEKLATWLDANLARLTMPTPPNIDAGAGASAGGKTPIALSPEELELARMAGMKPDEYAAYKLKKAAR